jgi:hypothetical protein
MGSYSYDDSAVNPTLDEAAIPWSVSLEKPPPATTAPAAAIPGNEEARQKALSDRFKSDPVGTARPLIEAMRKTYVDLYGATQIDINGLTHLDNEISRAMSWTATRDWSNSSRDIVKHAFQTQDLFNGGLTEAQLDARDKIANKIIDIGGDRPKVTVVPNFFAIKGQDGVQETPLFRVIGLEDHKPHFIDAQGLEYDSAGTRDIEDDEYRNWNGLPRVGTLSVMPADGNYTELAGGQLDLVWGPARVEGSIEMIRRVAYLDHAAAVGGVVLGTAVSLSSAGILSLPGGWLAAGSASWFAAGAIAGASEVYGLGVVANSLATRVRLGDELNPLSNPQVAIEAGSLVLGVGSLAQTTTLAVAPALRAVASLENKLLSAAAHAGDDVAAEAHFERYISWSDRAAKLERWGAPLTSPVVNTALTATHAVTLGAGGLSLADDWSDLSTGDAMQRVAMLTPSAFGLSLNLMASQRTALTYGPNDPTRAQLAGVSVIAGAGAGAIAEVGRRGYDLGLLGAPATSSMLGYIFRGSVGTARWGITKNVQSHVDKLATGQFAHHEIDWLRKNLVGAPDKKITTPAALGISLADRSKFKAALDTLEAQLPGDRSPISPAMLDEKALATLRSYSPVATLWNPVSTMGKVVEGVTYGTLALTNGATLKLLIDGKLEMDNVGHLAALSFLGGNLLASGRTIANRAAIQLKVPNIAATWPMRNAMGGANAFWATAAVPSTVLTGMGAHGALGVIKTGLFGEFGVGAAMGAYAGLKLGLTGKPAKMWVDPMLPLSLGLATLCAVSLVPDKKADGAPPAKADTPVTVPPSTPGAIVYPTTAAPKDVGYSDGQNPPVRPPEWSNQAANKSEAPPLELHTQAPQTNDSASSVPLPSLAPDPDPATTQPATAETDAPPAKPMSPPVVAQQPGTEAPPAETDIHVGFSKTNDTLWHIAATNRDRLLTTEERSSPQSARDLTQLAMHRLMQINPQFDASLLDGKRSSNPRDPDSLRPGTLVNINTVH